jgi:hypothetical protein
MSILSKIFAGTIVSTVSGKGIYTESTHYKCKNGETIIHSIVLTDGDTGSSHIPVYPSKFSCTKNGESWGKCCDDKGKMLVTPGDEQCKSSPYNVKLGLDDDTLCCSKDETTLKFG